MSTSVNLGCIFCGHTLNLMSPDLIHTEPSRAFRIFGTWLDLLDFQFMNAICENCNKGNWIFWYKPLSH